MKKVLLIWMLAFVFPPRGDVYLWFCPDQEPDVKVIDDEYNLTHPSGSTVERIYLRYDNSTSWERCENLDQQEWKCQEVK